MKFRAPILLFLDEDVSESAKCLIPTLLERGIRCASQVLMCTAFYMTGIRSETLFRHYVCRDRWERTKSELFPNYPLNNEPKFTFYTSPEARWCRKCHDHYRLVAEYLRAMLDEHEFRTGGEHPLSEMHGFLAPLPLELTATRGLSLPCLKDRSKLQLPWKNLPLKYRKRDIVAGYRAYYRSLVPEPMAAFEGTRRDVPEFLLEKPYIA